MEVNIYKLKLTTTMEITKLINDVLSTFTSYIVDCAADPGYMPQIKKSLEDTCKGAANVNEIVSHMEILAGDIASMSTQTRDYLNVYSSNPMEPYSGGIALIAASHLDGAHKILEAELNNGYGQYDAPEIVEGLRYIGYPGVIFDATYRE